MTPGGTYKMLVPNGVVIKATKSVDVCLHNFMDCKSLTILSEVSKKKKSSLCKSLII